MCHHENIQLHLRLDYGVGGEQTTDIPHWVPAVQSHELWLLSGNNTASLCGLLLLHQLTAATDLHKQISEGDPPHDR